ncbi:MAG TPA: TIM barrel protein [Acidobacteriota bacterium]|jgi:sugar phosphate isomerase/epimerase
MKTSRRDFIKTSAAVSGLVGFPASISAGQVSTPKATKGLRLGTVTYNIAKDWDIDAIIKNLTEVGMDAVELRTTHAHGVEITLPPERRQWVRQRFEESPVKIGGLGTTCEYHAADPALVKKNVEETKQWIKLARDVGSPSVKVRPNGLRKDVPEEKTLEQIGKSLKECGVFAQEHGIKVQLEVHGPETARVPRIARILQYADHHPGVFVCWNSNQDDLLDGGLETNFGLVKSRIGQVHMRDLFVEEYPFRRLIQLLSGMNFQGYCFAEIPSSQDPVRVLKYFRGLFRAYQGII